MVRPQLEYAAPVWTPYHQTEIGRIEKVQRTAARCACRRWRNQSHVSGMLEELEWLDLQERRQQVSLSLFYKIHNNQAIVNKDKYLSESGRGKMRTRSRPFQYCKTLIFGGHFILAILAEKKKTAKLKCRQYKAHNTERRKNIIEHIMLFPLPKYQSSYTSHILPQKKMPRKQQVGGNGV